MTSKPSTPQSKIERAVDVCDLQVDVADVDARVDGSVRHVASLDAT
jgi:hypothetical protein